MRQHPHSSRTYAVAPAAFVFPPLTSMLAAIGVEVFLAYALLVSLGLGAWWFWSRRRRTVALDDHSLNALELSHSQREPAVVADELPLLVASDRGSVMEPAPFEDNAQEQIFFPADEKMPPRSCPRCDRTFPGLFEVCPFDKTPLVEGRPSADKDVPTMLSRRFCPECDRRFGPSSRFCYFDGARLRQDFVELSAQAPPLRLCRQCGFETFEKINHCPRDDHDLELLDPATQERIVPTIAMNHCYRCGHLGLPSETICPVDGTLMLPQLSARPTALPSTGYGSRRRICTTCGAQFGDAAHFCSFDGEDLRSIN